MRSVLILIHTPACYYFSIVFVYIFQYFFLENDPPKVNNRATCLNLVCSLSISRNMPYYPKKKNPLNPKRKSLRTPLFCHCGGLKEGLPISHRSLNMRSPFGRYLWFARGSAIDSRSWNFRKLMHFESGFWFLHVNQVLSYCSRTTLPWFSLGW